MRLDPLTSYPLFSKNKLDRACVSLAIGAIELVYYLVTMNQVFGGDAGGATPVPIPNTEVKSTKADDTWTARFWESR